MTDLRWRKLVRASWTEYRFIEDARLKAIVFVGYGEGYSVVQYDGYGNCIVVAFHGSFAEVMAFTETCLA